MNDKKLTFDPTTGELIIKEVEPEPINEGEQKSVLRFKDGEMVMMKVPAAAPKADWEIDCSEYLKGANF